jgi:hypothetical protein
VKPARVPLGLCREDGGDRHMARGSTDIQVDSSLIRSVAYGNDATLTVRFHNGAVYRYFTVPRAVLNAFLAASSKGAYFNHHIRDHFPYRRLAEPDTP